MSDHLANLIQSAADGLFMHLLLLERTRELVAGCPCESGCPSCVGPEGNTGPHAKAVALRILDELLANTPVLDEPDARSLPEPF